jgi:hypothetical protein
VNTVFPQSLLVGFVLLGVMSTTPAANQRDAALSEFERVAAQFPVLRIVAPRADRMTAE